MSSLTYSLKSFPYRDVPLKLRPLLLKRVGFDDYLRLLGVDRGLREYALKTGAFSRQISIISCYIVNGEVIKDRLLATYVTIKISFRDGTATKRRILPMYLFFIDPTEEELQKRTADWQIVVPMAKKYAHLFNKITTCSYLVINSVHPPKHMHIGDDVNPQEDVLMMFPWIQSVDRLEISLPNRVIEFLLNHLRPQVSVAAVCSGESEVDRLETLAETIRTHFSDTCRKIEMRRSNARIFEVMIASKTIRIITFMLNEHEFKDLVAMILSLDSPIEQKFILTYSSSLAFKDEKKASDLVKEIEKILLSKTQPFLIKESQAFNFDDHFLNHQVLISGKFFKRELNPCVDSILQLKLFEEAFKLSHTFRFH